MKPLAEGEGVASLDAKLNEVPRPKAVDQTKRKGICLPRKDRKRSGSIMASDGEFLNRHTAVESLTAGLLRWP